MRVRAFLVRLPSGARYWTVLDENLAVVGEADVFLRHVRFGRDGSATGPPTPPTWHALNSTIRITRDEREP
jgi:hypothetical protein